MRLPSLTARQASTRGSDPAIVWRRLRQAYDIEKTGHFDLHEYIGLYVFLSNARCASRTLQLRRVAPRSAPKASGGLGTKPKPHPRTCSATHPSPDLLQSRTADAQRRGARLGAGSLGARARRRVRRNMFQAFDPQNTGVVTLDYSKFVYAAAGAS